METPGCVSRVALRKEVVGISVPSHTNKQRLKLTALSWLRRLCLCLCVSVHTRVPGVQTHEQSRALEQSRRLATVHRECLVGAKQHFPVKTPDALRDQLEHFQSDCCTKLHDSAINKLFLRVTKYHTYSTL